MKSSTNWDQERYSGPVHQLQRYHPLPSHASPQSARPVPAAVQGRWLATLNATLEDVREAILATLSEMPSELAYLYHADDKVVVRAIHDQHRIRVEITPIDACSTRVIVIATIEGEPDRAMSTRMVRAIEARLTPEHA